MSKNVQICCTKQSKKTFTEIASNNKIFVEVYKKRVMLTSDIFRSIEALFGADADTAAQARAEYVYSAYGEVMMKSGDLADKNNITYSTRYQEANTGLVSYTYRHYSPRLKKWLSKDPIAENGGLNLYQMVGNMPVGKYDKLGKLSSTLYKCRRIKRYQDKYCAEYCDYDCTCPYAFLNGGIDYRTKMICEDQYRTCISPDWWDYAILAGLAIISALDGPAPIADTAVLTIGSIYVTSSLQQ